MHIQRITGTVDVRKHSTVASAARFVGAMLAVALLGSAIAGCCCPRKGDPDGPRDDKNWTGKGWVGHLNNTHVNDPTKHIVLSRRRARTLTLDTTATQPAPGSTIEATDSNEFPVVLGIATQVTSVTEPPIRQSIWDGLLLAGAITIANPASGGKAGSVTLAPGTQLYIRATTLDAGTAPAGTSGAATGSVLSFPIVVTGGSVQAGSVGTEWFCWYNGTTYYFVLLAPESGELGTLYISNDNCMVANGSCHRVVNIADNYVAIPSTGIVDTANPPVQAPIPAGHPLESMVSNAKMRALTAGLR